MKFTVEETFKGIGLVHFDLSEHPQTIRWAKSKDKSRKYVLLETYHYPEYIMKSIDLKLNSFLAWR